MSVRILIGDCRERLKELPDASVHCCVTSPPYFGLRDYGHAGQMGLEPTPDEFVAGMVEVFREVKRVLRDDGTLWLNIGDSYAARVRQSGAEHAGALSANSGQIMTMRRALPTGYKEKDLIGIPWLLAFALRADGWYLRQDIIWSKSNPMPESVRDRCTKAHEYLFLLSKGPRYYFDQDPIREPLSEATIQRDKSPRGRSQNGGASVESLAGYDYSRLDLGNMTSNVNGANKRSVWEVATQPFSEAHFATYPPALIEPCILAGCPKDGTVLDPFGGAGTTGMVADRLGRDAILIELNPEYAAIAEKRLSNDGGMFVDVRAA